ncbi:MULTISPECIES: hypothetical protein [Fischerella]|uniref:Peptide ABC transporter substrate-binding protein n=1 Tax=Fischerella muscicola CCMEE 5323 TaxID=2019572 RepID=A0A2N6JYI4_FISMU|nr:MULTISPECIES: hypothetical protein [Fischerella]MBD2429723.1 hypothetical protein [Fischerella sp. FACHB-380]PLZ85815.1 hypothetical protein CEN44_21360 [Fischerella muscicola CCMEE 5323]
MTKSFLTDSFHTSTPAVDSSTSLEKIPSRESVKVVIYGSKKGVNSTIVSLYKLGFAQMNEWSPLVPTSKPGEVMSILVGI